MISAQSQQEEVGKTDRTSVTPLAAPRQRTWQRWLAGQLVPGGGPATHPIEAVLAFAVLCVLVFFRLGSAAIHARVWAEDGGVFLQGTVNYGRLGAIVHPYAGYGHLVPRLAAAFTTLLPIHWWGGGLHVADAVVVGWVAVIVYVALADHLPSRVLRGLAALYVALVPVGPEITGSIANLQWHLIVGAFVALFWTPTRWFGWLAICLTVFAAVTSSPLGLLILGAAAVRYAVQAGRGPLSVVAVTAVGTVAQLIVQLNAAQRPLGNGDAPGAAVRGYVARVVGDGVLGIDRHVTAGPASSLVGHNSTSVTAGVLVLVVVAVVIATAVVARWSAPWLVAGALLIFSVATFAAAVVPQKVPLSSAVAGGRYYVPPAMCLVLALFVLAGALLTRARTRPERAREWPARLLVPISSAVLVGALAFAVVNSYNEAGLRGRNSYTTWSKGVTLATRTCRTNPGLHRVTVRILPDAGWFVRLPCSRLR